MADRNLKASIFAGGVPAQPRPWRKLKQAYCPHCDKPFNGYAMIVSGSGSGAAILQAGDYTFCLECGKWVEADITVGFKAPTQADVDRLDELWGDKRDELLEMQQAGELAELETPE
jgi:hypothetical protein